MENDQKKKLQELQDEKESIVAILTKFKNQVNGLSKDDTNYFDQLKLWLFNMNNVLFCYQQKGYDLANINDEIRYLFINIMNQNQRLKQQYSQQKEGTKECKQKQYKKFKVRSNLSAQTAKDFLKYQQTIANININKQQQSASSQSQIINSNTDIAIIKESVVQSEVGNKKRIMASISEINEQNAKINEKQIPPPPVQKQQDQGQQQLPKKQLLPQEQPLPQQPLQEVIDQKKIQNMQQFLQQQQQIQQNIQIDNPQQFKRINTPPVQLPPPPQKDNFNINNNYLQLQQQRLQNNNNVNNYCNPQHQTNNDQYNTHNYNNIYDQRQQDPPQNTNNNNYYGKNKKFNGANNGNNGNNNYYNNKKNNYRNFNKEDEDETPFDNNFNQQANNKADPSTSGAGGFISARDQLSINQQKKMNQEAGVRQNPPNTFYFEDVEGSRIINLANQSVFGKNLDVPKNQSYAQKQQLQNNNNKNNYNSLYQGNQNQNNYCNDNNNQDQYGGGGNGNGYGNYNNNNNQQQGQKSVGLKKKFVPPYKKEGGNSNGGSSSNNGCKLNGIQDERLAKLDQKCVDLIMGEIVDRSPKITWDLIAGLDFAKKTIKELIVLPLLMPEIFTGIRAPPKGLLLFGPPGTGKTLIGKAIASESNSTFFSISASSLTSKWVGEGEKMVRTLFTIARVQQPSVIFVDEIDSLLTARTENDIESSRRIKTEFLVQLDGAGVNDEDRILLIGATNRPQELDEAARRRFVKRLYIPLPNKKAREELIKNVVRCETSKGNCYDINDEEILKIVDKTKQYSGADMKNLCAEAAMNPIRSCPDIMQITAETLRPTNFNDFLEAVKFVKPSVSEKDLGGYLKWNEDFGTFNFNKEDLEN